LIESSGNAGTFSNLTGSFAPLDDDGSYPATIAASGYVPALINFALFANQTNSVGQIPLRSASDGFEP
jgi:hypothetical protein